MMTYGCRPHIIGLPLCHMLDLIQKMKYVHVFCILTKPSVLLSVLTSDPFRSTQNLCGVYFHAGQSELCTYMYITIRGVYSLTKNPTFRNSIAQRPQQIKLIGLF